MLQPLPQTIFYVVIFHNTHYQRHFNCEYRERGEQILLYGYLRSKYILS